jgi:hypothetical protein
MAVRAVSSTLVYDVNVTYNFQAFGQSKKNESLGPKTKVISGIASSSFQ